MIDLLRSRSRLTRSPKSSSRISRAEVRGRADILFIIDISSSMSGLIGQLKSNLAELIKKTLESVTADFGVSNPQMRLSIVGFRDLEEDPVNGIVIPSHRFSSDEKDLLRILSSADMDAKGGETYPGESALDAIWRAMNYLEWGLPSRLIVLFTDSAPKKSLHPSSVKGEKMSPTTTIALLSRKIIENKIKIVIFGPAGVDEFRKIGALDYCRYIELDDQKGRIPAFYDPEEFRSKILAVLQNLIPKQSVTPNY